MNRPPAASGVSSGRHEPPAGADVLHLGKLHPDRPGGIEQVLRGLLDATRGRLTHHCLVAGPDSALERDERSGAVIESVRASGSFLLAPLTLGLPAALHRLRASGRFPLLVLHAPNPIAVVALALSFARRPKREKLAIWLHAEPEFSKPWQRAVHAVYRLFERPVLRRADRFVVATPHHLAVLGSLRRYRERTVVVPYSVPDGWAAASALAPGAVDAVRARMGGPFALFVGRLAAYKGLATLVAAAARTEHRFAVVGEGPLASEVAAQVRELGLASRVALVGHVDDPRPWYAACDLLVLPSTSNLEAFGVVQIEAMAFGRPVVSSALESGVTWVNRDGVTGLTVPPGDSAALAAAVSRLMSDPELRQRLGEGGRRRVEAEFSAAATASGLERLVAELGGDVRL